MDKEANLPQGWQAQNHVISSEAVPESELTQEASSRGLEREHIETSVNVVAEKGDEQSDSPCHSHPRAGEGGNDKERIAQQEEVPAGAYPRDQGREGGGQSMAEKSSACLEDERVRNADDNESDQTQAVQQEPAQDPVALELAQLKDQHLRLAAEFDNYKRRSQQEWQQKLKYATNGFVGDLLSVLDNLEQAISAAETALQQADHAPLRTLLAGMQMVHKQLESTLRQQGVRPLDPVGKPFDPNQHEAVGQQPDNSVAEGTVLQQAQAGYLLHDRLVRPARVVIATPVQIAATSDEDESG